MQLYIINTHIVCKMFSKRCQIIAVPEDTARKKVYDGLGPRAH